MDIKKEASEKELFEEERKSKICKITGCMEEVKAYIKTTDEKKWFCLKHFIVLKNIITKEMHGFEQEDRKEN